MSGQDSSSSIISLPQGGGALQGLGEKFSPDPHTGTGNFTVPISVPAGRNGFQPSLSLGYSTGQGNGPFGLGWDLTIPRVSRKTSKGVPRYRDVSVDSADADTFVLSGSEDLVSLSAPATSPATYRPRTEGLFADIQHHSDAVGDYWEVRTKDGLTSYYGTPGGLGADPAVIADPGGAGQSRVFAWLPTATVDPFGNRIEYEYERETGSVGGNATDQLYLRQIRYVDYNDGDGQARFLVSVTFEYEVDRPDSFCEYRAGFAIRTTRRCSSIAIATHAGEDLLVHTYDLVYLDQRPELAADVPPNAASLLSQVISTGHDGENTESMPPLEFAYTSFRPGDHVLAPVAGSALPATSLADPNLNLVDLFGQGLPDILEMGTTVRYWRNRGGSYDVPRLMTTAPAGVALADPGVQLIDANGNGTADVVVTTPFTSGFYPMRFGGLWDGLAFRTYPVAPAFDLKDTQVKLVDLTGDGVTDAIRADATLECFFNHPAKGWYEARTVAPPAGFPGSFADPHVKWGDMSGDGLHDVLVVRDSVVDYWPNLGHGSWGETVSMTNCPALPFGYDPSRILVGDVDGDGLADIVYVDSNSVTLWINQSGNRWGDPIVIAGTPGLSSQDAVRLADVYGYGVVGVLWSKNVAGPGMNPLTFLDFTGGTKPYLLDTMDNHIGALTKVGYAPSVRYYLDDDTAPDSRWRTVLPIPVQVVARVEVIDAISRGKLTTEYRYHHGYWDGVEREFRGFGMVEQLDSETFAQYNGAGLHGDADFAQTDGTHFCPPTLTKTWYHQGPIGDEYGDPEEMDWSDLYWPGDPQILGHTETINNFVASWPATSAGRQVKRDALRALRGSVLRTECYALDGTDRENRPYTVTESAYQLAEIAAPGPADGDRTRIFYPHATAQRTSQWERGDDPMTQVSYTRYTDDAGVFDPFGRALAHTQIACPRGWQTPDDRPAQPYLATRTLTTYATPIAPSIYIHNRVARTTAFEIVNSSGRLARELAAIPDGGADLTLIGHTVSHYDGDPFAGLPAGQVGAYGALTRTAQLVLTDEILQAAYGADTPPYVEPTGNPAWTADYPTEFRALLPARAGYTYHAGGPDPADPAGYFVNTDRRRYDFHSSPAGTGRGLVLEGVDPVHDAAADPAAHRTLIAYDAFDLLPEQVTDAAGLTVRATHDYRVLQPSEVQDANGNRNAFTFSPLGLLTSSFVRGDSPAEGDQTRPGVHLEYGFLAFENSPPASRQPIFVRTTRQVHHDTDLDVPLPERDETIIKVEYSDGFGRLVQTRAQGEDVRYGDEHFGGGDAVLPAQQSDGAGADLVGRDSAGAPAPNVVVSGWQVYDNKARVVEKYEPFFSEGWDFAQPGEAQAGEKVTIFYDPRGRPVRTRNPDASEQHVVHGVPGTTAAPDLDDPETFEPTPWEAYTYDANDNAGRTHPAESAGYDHHWNTPASIVIDALGRTIDAVERNREMRANPGDPLPPIEELHVRTTYDIRGNILTVTDALGRTAFEHVYDYANRPLRTSSIDAGQRMTVLDALGAVVEQRDSKGALLLHGYDVLNRPVRLWGRDGTGQVLTLRERLEYGDAGDANQAAADRAASAAANQLGKPSRQFDEAGVLSFDQYDFKGNLLEKTRHVVSDAAIVGVFDGPPPNWDVQAFRVDWADPALVPLDPNAFTTSSGYDALNRAKTLTYPQDVAGERRRLRPRYNRAGALEKVALERSAADGGLIDESFVERIAYNAKGQRLLIAYGNGIMTRYAYDPRTLRLLRMRTDRYQQPVALTYHPTGAARQDLAYRSDLAGNILEIRDRAPHSGVPGTPQGPDALDRAFTYDALYRLRSATGRECDQPPPPAPWDARPRSTDLTKTRSYTERYTYDAAGSITQLKHVATVGFSRDFTVDAGSNRLLTMSVGALNVGYEYDLNGNLVAETTSRHFDWDCKDRMKVYRTQAGISEPSVHAQYLYDCQRPACKEAGAQAGRPGRGHHLHRRCLRVPADRQGRRGHREQHDTRDGQREPDRAGAGR